MMVFVYNVRRVLVLSSGFCHPWGALSERSPGGLADQVVICMLRGKDWNTPRHGFCSRKDSDSGFLCTSCVERKRCNCSGGIVVWKKARGADISSMIAG